MKTNPCWQRAYEQISNGKDENAAKICSEEDCSSTHECQQFLGWHYLGLDEYEKALFWFTPLAEKNDAEGLYGLAATNLSMGNHENAFDLHTQAMKKGHPRSYYWLGYMCQFGLGVAQDISAAKNYYNKSAKHGYLIAERAILHLETQEGGLKHAKAILKIPFLMLKGFYIARKNINDERLVEIPNPLGNWGK